MTSINASQSKMSLSCVLIALMLMAGLSACGGAEQTSPAPKDNAAVENVTAADAATTQSPPTEPASIEPIKEAPPADKEAVPESPTAKVVSEVVLADDAGQKRYEATCSVCHGQGLLDAPKLSDKAAWQSRISKGKETLYQHSIHGFNKMPAQAVGDISEDEVRAAVDYMVGQAS